ncbi:MAG: hypothetical protein ABSG62_03330 [Terracidiphilus sp.]
MDTRTLQKLTICGFLAVAMLTTRQLNAQNLTLEGQTGGFLTPTAYVVYSAKGQTFSHPAVGYHFIDAAKVIGDIQTFSITEGFAGRGEVGYTRSVHTLGDSTDPAQGAFSNLWNFDGMNVFHGKVVGIKDGQFGPWTPGIAVGGVVRTGDKFVSGALVQQLAALQGVVVPAKSYTNGDVYIAFTKTWAKPPVPFLLNLGWKATNATIFGIGGQSTRFAGRLFGGLGIPLPVSHGIVAVPSAGFTQEPHTSVNLGAIIPTVGPYNGVHLPTTLDYAVRVTQREHPHFAFDIGIGQVAGMIGTAVLPTGLPPPYPPTFALPVNLEARHVVGMGISIRP